MVSYSALDGVADLSSASVELCDSHVARIKGNWRFFWGEFLSGKEVASRFGDESRARYLRVPGQWNQFRDASGNEVGATGFATLAVKVRLGSDGCSAEQLKNQLGVYVREATSAYEFEAVDSDGTPLSQVVSGGIIGKDAESSKPLYQRQRVRFPWSRELFLVWRISNFHHVRGGPVNPIDFGLGSAVDKSWEFFNLLELVALGMILIICVYSFLLYLYVRKQQQPLWLSLFCLVIAIRLLVTNNVVEHFYPNVDLFMPLHRANVVSVALAGLTFYMYCRSQFKICFQRWFDLLFWIGTLFYTVVASIAPLPVYYSLLIVPHCLVGTVIVLATCCHLFSKKERAAKGHFFSLVGIVILSLSAALELVSHYEIFYIPIYASNGLVIFLLLEAIRIAIDNQRSRLKLDRLATQLELSRGRIESVLSATRLMAEVTKPLDAAEVTLLALLKEVVGVETASADVLIFSFDLRADGMVPQVVTGARFAFGVDALGHMGVRGYEGLKPSDDETGAAVKLCREMCGQGLSERRMTASKIGEREVVMAFLRETLPACLFRLRFPGPVSVDDSFPLFVETLSESFNGILENIERSAQERVHLENLVSLASSISDKLNSPLMAARNVADRIEDHLAKGELDSAGLGRLARLSKILNNALGELQATSKELEVLRDSGDVEPTKILTGITEVPSKD
jgi:hypothetical protein